jgi:hypothetical protein
MNRLRANRHEAHVNSAMAMTAFMAGGFVCIAAVLYALHRVLSASRLESWQLFGLLLFAGCALSALVFAAITRRIVRHHRELRRITERLESLASAPRFGMLERLPSASRFETGELTDALNALQDRFAREYERLEKDLRLASQVRGLQWSETLDWWGRWRISCSGERKRVDGVFLETVPLDENRLFMAAGVVNGPDMPAALAASALIMVIRTHGAPAAERPAGWLDRVTAWTADIITSGLELNIAAVMIDESAGTVSWAVRGRAAVGMLRDGRTETFGNAACGAGVQDAGQGAGSGCIRIGDSAGELVILTGNAESAVRLSVAGDKEVRP